jgi:hypothetical protein
MASCSDEVCDWPDASVQPTSTVSPG